jgi:hypothetical protein
MTNIVSIPVFSWCTYLLFRHWKYNYAEHLVLNAYITAQQLLLLVIWFPLFGWLADPPAWPQPVYAGLTLVYNFWVYVQLFRRGTR